jgi:hypothetical protein
VSIIVREREYRVESPEEEPGSRSPAQQMNCDPLSGKNCDLLSGSLLDSLCGSLLSLSLSGSLLCISSLLSSECDLPSSILLCSSLLCSSLLCISSLLPPSLVGKACERWCRHSRRGGLLS